MEHASSQTIHFIHENDFPRYCIVGEQIAIMHILIIIHVLQNGTKWLPFITVVEDNIFPHPHDSEPYFGTFGHPVFL